MKYFSIWMKKKRKLFYSLTRDIFDKDLKYNDKISVFKEFLTKILATKRTHVNLENIYSIINENLIF